jgi:hypothetical protein
MPTAKFAQAKTHWAHHIWAFLHTICIGYSTRPYYTDIEEKLKTFVTLMPCEICLDTYVEYLDKLTTLDKADPMCLFKWSVDLHNAVNKKLNKPEISFDDAFNLWGIWIEGTKVV